MEQEEIDNRLAARRTVGTLALLAVVAIGGVVFLISEIISWVF